MTEEDVRMEGRCIVWKKKRLKSKEGSGLEKEEGRGVKYGRM